MLTLTVTLTRKPNY